MKTMRKVFALLMALSMILALAITANAEGETTEAAPGTITINPGTPDDATANKPTYTYYVMMKASVGENDAVSYYVETEALANALVGTGYFTATRVGTTNHWNIGLAEDKENATGEQVAAALQGIKGSAIATDSVSEDDDYTIALGYDAYVLIESSLGTKLVVDTYTTKEVNEKNEYPSITKTSTVKNAEIGKPVSYSIPVVIPATVAEKPITITDTISKGLTMQLEITANQGVTGLAWTLSKTNEDGSKVYTVEIPAATVKANAGKTVTLTYNAIINEDAVVGTSLTNTAELKYDEYNSVTVGEEDADVKTFGFTVKKVDGTTKDPLTSTADDPIKFSLTRLEGEGDNAKTYYYTVPTSSENNEELRFQETENTVAVDYSAGTFTFAGLAAGTYTLTETETVDGYNLLTDAITVTIGENGAVTAPGAEGDVVTVENNAGVELPSTGGIGTTIFTVVGATLMIGAAVLFVTKKRSAI